MKFSKSWTAAVVLVTLTGSAQAALVNRGGGMIYDTTLNITWLADMNYAKTSGYAASGVAPGSSNNNTNTIWTDGRMGWGAANTWANNLVYGGFDDWRLASTNPSDTTCSNNFNFGGGFPTQYYGFNCTGGELTHLFVADLGNKANESVLTQTGDTAEQIANLALFSNVQSLLYWSGVEFAPNTAVAAWAFDTLDGEQGQGLKFVPLLAVAVRPGDVAASVPEPQTFALVLMGFGAAGLARRKRLA
jgi:hypothetical protein